MGIQYNEMRDLLEASNGMLTLAREDLTFPDGAVEVHRWASGDISGSARGGGFAFKSLEEVLSKYSFRVATKKDLDVPWEAGWFEIEGGEVYPGYHNKSNWNGWAQPAFELAVARRICEGAQFQWWHYHRGDDTFYTLWEDNIWMGEEPAIRFRDAVERYKGRDITVGGRSVHVYDIGNGWCWTLDTCEGCIQPGKRPHEEYCYVVSADPKIDQDLVRTARLRDIKGLWDMWGFGDDEAVSGPIYDWLKREVR